MEREYFERSRYDVKGMIHGIRRYKEEHGNVPSFAASALHVACSLWDFEAVTTLVEEFNYPLAQPQHIKLPDDSYDTPLHLLLSFPYFFMIHRRTIQDAIRILQYLIERDPTVLKITNSNHELPFHTAVKNGIPLDVLKTLSVGNVNTTTNGDTALHLACDYKKRKSLLSIQTTLSFRNLLKIITFLTVQKECDVSIVNGKGNLPLHVAINSDLLLDEDTRVSILSKLCNCDVNIRNIDGNTPLHLACQRGNQFVVKFLIVERRCSITIANNEGNVPLHVISKQLSLDTVKLVTDCSIVNTQNKNGHTPIHLACENGIGKDIINFLTVEQRCDITIVDNKGNLPLHVAISHDLPLDEDISILSNFCNCDVNIENTDGNTPLHLACQRGNQFVVKFLTVEKRCDMSVANNEGNLPLHVAIGKRQSFDIMKLITNCLFVNTQNKNGDTLLHLALKDYYNREAIRYLAVEQRCDMSIVNDEGNLPLHIAISERCSLDIIKIVTYYNIVNAQNKDGNTPLHLACQQGDQFVIKFLTVNQQCDIAIRNNEGNVPLHVISKRLSLETVKLVTDCSIVNTQNKNGHTPIHLVCENGIGENIFNFLIMERKCDITIVDNKGNLPLHVAISRDLPLDEDILSNLCNCDVNIQNVDGNTPLHLACQRGNQFVVQFLVVERRCSISIANNDGNVPLHVISKQLSFDAVKLVTDCSIVNTQNKNGHTPIHLACENGIGEDIFNFLITEQRCDITIVDNKGNLPLHVAISHDLPLDEDILSKLCNCDVNIQNINGNTPLHLACQRGNQFVVKFLVVERRCSITIANNDGNVPLHIISKQLSLDSVKLVTDCSIVNAQNKNGHTPIHLACENGIGKDIIIFLIIEQKCDITIVDNKGNLPLHVAISHDLPLNENILSNLCNCNVNIQNIDGNTPLHLACQRGNQFVVNFLTVEKRCDMSIANNEGNLPLHVAVCQQRSLPIVELVTNCSIVNIQNKNGDTPLHLACENTTTNITRYLTLQQRSDMSITDNEGNTPLHVAIRKLRPLHIVKLVSNFQCQNIRNKNGNSPLELACMFKHIEVVKFLVEGDQCDLTVRSENGELPLHYACHYLPCEIVALICHHCNHDLNSTTDSGDTPLHVACRHGHLDTVKYLVNDLECDIAVLNKDQFAPVHVAISKGHIEIAKFFIEDKLCNLLISDNDSALFLMRKQLVEFYGSSNKRNLQPLKLQCDGTLLHYACRFNREFLLCKLVRMKCDALQVSNAAGEFPIHIACQQHNARLVRLLAEHGVSAKTALGNTPLHECCKTSTLQTLNEDRGIIEYLFQKPDCDPNSQNNDGLTPLHFAVKFGNVELVQLLICKGNPNVPDNSGQTPIMYAPPNKPQMLKVLLQHGADPSHIYELHKEYFRANSSETPPETPLKILVIGNASTGKTTVIASLKCEGGIDPQSAKPHTAGIIPSRFDSEIYGLVTWYDFAGQPEYYASNEALLQCVISASPPVVLILVDISETEKDIEESLLYWFKFIEHQCQTERDKPLLIVVGSHADKLNLDSSVVMEDIIKRIEPKFVNSNIDFVCSVVMDCRLPGSPEINQLQKALKTCSEKLCNIVELNFTTHCFYVFLLDKFKSHAAVTIDEVINCCETLTQYGKDLWSHNVTAATESDEHIFPCEEDIPSTQQPSYDSELANKEEISDEQSLCDSESDDSILLEDLLLQEEEEFTKPDPLGLLPTRPSEIIALCEELNKRDHLILLRDNQELKSWLIFDKEFLLSEVNGTMFAPKDFAQYESFASSTGVVVFDKFNANFPKHDPNMLIGFLSHLEFCREIEDPEVLELLKHGSAGSSNRYFFFPSLIQIDKPEDVWKQDSQPHYDYHYSSGWVVECSESGDYFSPRFIQVLLLRLAFTFPLSLPKRRSRGVEHPTIKRQCSVWKNGLSWRTNDGIETVVVMAEQSQAVHVMMRSQCEVPQAFTRLRSSVIKKVVETAQDFNAFATVESFIDPSELQCPPKSCEESFLYSCSAVAKAIHQKTHFLTSDGLKCLGQITLENLLSVEPYAELGSGILSELYCKADLETATVISEEFQEKIASSIDKCPGNSKALLCDIFHCCTPTSPSQLMKEMRQWTYSQLKEVLDLHSVFCGRNILELSGECEAVDFPTLQSTKQTHLALSGVPNVEAASSASENPQTNLGLVIPPCKVDELASVLIEIAGRWDLFLGQLGIENSKRRTIQLNNANKPDFAERCLFDGLDYWVLSDEKPTCEKIVRALRGDVLHDDELAVKVERFADTLHNC